MPKATAKAQIEYLQGEVKRLREMHALLEDAGKGKVMRVEIDYTPRGGVTVTVCDPRGNRTPAVVALLSALSTQAVAVLDGARIDIVKAGQKIAEADAAEGVPHE